MSAPVLVRPVQLPDEPSPVARPLRHDSPVTAPGVPCEVQIDGRWRPAIITRVVFSTVHVQLKANS